MVTLASAVGRPSRAIESFRELTAIPGSGSAWGRGSCGPVQARCDDPDDRQVECLGELEVALVVAGYGHDRAGAVTLRT